MSEGVNNTIEQAKNRELKKYLDNNSVYSFFLKLRKRY